MSDNLARNRWSFEEEIRVSEPELRYALKTRERKIICTLDMPYPLLKKWHGIVQGYIKPNSSQTSQQDMNTEGQTSSSSESALTVGEDNSVNYVDLLDYCIPGRFFQVTADKVIRNKVDESLSKIVGGVAQLYKKSRGRARMDLDKRVRKFHVFEGKTMSLREKPCLLMSYMNK